MRYPSFDEAVRMVQKSSVGAELVKFDIKSTFWILPVHPQDFDLFRIHFQGLFYIDRAFPMGCLVSCTALEHFSSFIE